MSASVHDILKIAQRPTCQVLAFAVIALMLLVAVMGVGLGLAQDRDSAAIVARFPEILKFHYVPSRSWGNPLYEILAAYMDAVGGLVLVNLASAFFTLIYALALYSIIRPDQNVQSLLTFAACVLNPLVLSNSSALMEFALCIALAMLSLACALVYVRRRTLGALYGVLLNMGLMVLTRPDSVLFAITLTACLLVERRREPAALRRIMLGVGSTGAVVLGIYVLLNHGLEFLVAPVIGGRSAKTRVEYAVVSLMAIYGLLGSAVLLALVGLTLIRGWRSVLKLQRPTAFVDRLAVVTVAVYLPRFFALPDQLEYFFVPLIMSVIFLGRNLRSELLLGLITMSLVLNSVLQVGLFVRAERQIVFAPTLNWGAVVQDWRARILNRARDMADFRDYVAKSVYGNAESPPVLHAEWYLDGFTSDTGDLVVGKASAYQIDDPELAGWLPRFRSSSYRHIYICDEELATRQAWRVLQPAPLLGALKRFESHQPLTCKIRN